MRSKKLLICLVFLFVSLFAFNFNTVSVKAADVDANIKVEGAQVRTSGNAGIRFVATEAFEVAPESAELGIEETGYGFVLAFGEVENPDEFVVDGTVNGKEVGNARVESAENGTFAVTLYDIPEFYYTQKISVRAYVELMDGALYVYSEEICVKSLADVCKAAYADGNRTEFVVNVYDKIPFLTLNYNGGDYVAPYTITATKYNGTATGSYVTIASAAQYTSGSNIYWHRIFLKATGSANLYKVVAVAKVGAEYPELEYDYVLAVHQNCADAKAFEDAGTFVNLENATEYYAYCVAPTGTDATSCNVEVRFALNPDLFDGQKVDLSAGAELPTVAKEHYDFVGWYDNAELEGEATTTHTGAMSYYAKYTPTVYTITYNFNGGETTATLVETYTIESAAIVLPTAAEVDFAGFEFVGWYDNANLTGNPLTEIAAGSHGDIELYASWFIDMETTVELSAADTAAITALTPDKIVYAGVAAGNYVVNGVNYVTNKTAFPSLAAALSVAEEGDKIYVFAASYSDALEVKTANVTIYGPNYNIAGTATRSADEAVIDGVTLINAANVTLNGLKYTKGIQVKADNATITNCYIAPTETVAMVSANRKACITDMADGGIKGLTISNCYIDAPGTSNTYTRLAFAFNNVTDLTISNNYITNSQANTIDGTGSYAAMRIYTLKGTLTITNNDWCWATNGYIMHLGGNANSATAITIVDNTFDGNANVKHTATINVSKASASNCVVNIVGNEFYNFQGTTIGCNKSDAGTWNVMYNYFDANTSFSAANLATIAGLNISNNCYAAAQKTQTSDYGVITSLEALKEAYAAYKAQ